MMDKNLCDLRKYTCYCVKPVIVPRVAEHDVYVHVGVDRLRLMTVVVGVSTSRKPPYQSGYYIHDSITLPT